ncbi:hypothetical protein glysoja_028943 [Glycine soja]|uniref:Uncharacterized protein n=1 Tax=Glycine soja TaxID=3848 RepID=A0A0B2RJL4_GLYSO|nr:hypothetical protein glysoja_028943 [Glycine soja]
MPMATWASPCLIPPPPQLTILITCCIKGIGLTLLLMINEPPRFKGLIIGGVAF